MQPSGRRQLRPGPEAPAPGPARLGAAVDAIVGHLRRLVLLQAWDKWQPKLTQVRSRSQPVPNSRRPSSHALVLAACPPRLQQV